MLQKIKQFVFGERKRLLLSEHDLSGFPSEEDREIFVKRRLKEAGFDATKPVSIFSGVNVSARLYEQE